MSPIDAAGAKRRWLVSALAAALLSAFVLALFLQRPQRIVPGRGVVRADHGSAITLSPAPEDELAMRDLAPLFLPTEYNARPRALSAPEPAENDLGRDPGARWKFDRDSPALRLPIPFTAPKTPADAVTVPPPPLAQGLGRADVEVPVAASNGGHLDVYADDARNSLLSVTLPLSARPGAGAGPAGMDWKPAEFLAAVDTTGLVGPVTLLSSSGVEDVDAHFRNFLAQQFHLGDRLPPGFYRIVVGP